MHGQQRKSAYRMIQALVICLLAAGLLFVSGHTAFAQDTDTDQTRTLTVTGIGSATGSPDIAYIDIGLEVRENNIASAVEQVNQTIDSVVAALTEIGIPEENIQTTNYSIRQDQAPPQPVGTETDSQMVYVVSNMVQVRVSDTSQVSSVIQTALDAGANRMYGLRFGLDDSQALVSVARQDAVNNARMRAEELADLFGITLGNPIHIEEIGGNGQAVPVQTSAYGSGGAGPVINEGQLSVSVQIDVTYEIMGTMP